MAVLLAIGRFFKKIWDWIKQTAWIQPLLIVGIIFGIIFSIRPIIEATKKHRAKQGEFDKFYTTYRLSLNGEGEESSSEAGVFTTKLTMLMNGEIGKETFKSECGRDVEDKFFFAVVAKECTECDECKVGFATFKSKLNNAAEYYGANTEEKFDMVTIFQDEEKYKDSEVEDTPFYDYCLNHSDFFAEAAGVAEGSYYYKNNGISDSDIADLAEAQAETFNTPTILLIDLNSEESIISEVMFGVEGSSKDQKAKTLFNCWEHKGKFSESGK